jgi:hypothetical protein
MTHVQAGDIYVSGGREGWGERLIHFGTQRGALGVYVGGPLLALSLLLGLFIGNGWTLTASIILVVWIAVSIAMLEPKTWADHVMVAVTDGILGEATFAESTISGGLRLSHPAGKAPRWVLYRIPDLKDADKQNVASHASILVANGGKYRVKLNVAFGLDYVLGLGLFDVRLFRKNLVAKAANVCSAFVWRVYRECGIPGFERDPRLVSPDDFVDIGNRRWEIVGHGPSRTVKGG